MPSDIRAQIQSLKIPKEQRPAAVLAGPRRRFVGKLVLTGLFLTVAGVCLYVGRYWFNPPPDAAAAAVRLVKVSPHGGPETTPLLSATGKIVSDHLVQVHTKVSGQILALYFEQGDRVKKGQRLAQVEDVMYRARRDEAAAQLAQAKANLEFQKYNYQRLAGLFESNTAPKVEFADAQRAVREAEAQAAAGQAALDYVQKALDDCAVVAPIDGVILERNVEVGDFVAAEGGRAANANAQFALVADMSKLRVEIDISELDIARLKPDLPCRIIPEAYKDRRYHGHVLWIDPAANYSKATVQVKARIDNPDEYLRVEGSAQVVFYAEQPLTGTSTQPAGGMWIPKSACLLDVDGATGKVFVVRADGRLQATKVSMGRHNGGYIEVRAGLQAGQSIAAEGLDRLTDGQYISR